MTLDLLKSSLQWMANSMFKCKIINPKKAIPIHYNDYDVFKLRLQNFNKKEIKQACVEDRISFLLYGKTYTIEIKNT
jgi:L-ascorbate metabolism protein UlaG (beta-lactamase superfamily)